MTYFNLYRPAFEKCQCSHRWPELFMFLNGHAYICTGQYFPCHLVLSFLADKVKALSSSEEFDENYGKHRIPGLLAKNQSKVLHNMKDMYAYHFTMTHAT